MKNRKWSDYIVLLTACVNPGDMPYTILLDQDERRKQYIDSLRFYLENCKCPVVFCENTNCDFSSLFQTEIEEGRLEYLTYEGNNFDRSKGKGYGELEIIEYALSHSTLLKKANVIIKVTGRLQIRNINKLISINKFFPRPNIQLSYDYFGKEDMDSRIIFAPVSFYRQSLIVNKNQINDSNGFYFEHLLYKEVCRQSDGILLPFFALPDVCGSSGSTGKVYNQDGDFIYSLSKVYYSMRACMTLDRKVMKKKCGILLYCLLLCICSILKMTIIIREYGYKCYHTCL